MFPLSGFYNSNISVCTSTSSCICNNMLLPLFLRVTSTSSRLPVWASVLEYINILLFFGCAHKDRVYVRAFIGVSMRSCLAASSDSHSR